MADTAYMTTYVPKASAMKKVQKRKQAKLAYKKKPGKGDRSSMGY